MNVTYVTNFPSVDVKYWSGTVHYMAKGLEERAHVDYITDLKEDWTFSLKVKNKLFGSNKVYRADRSPEFGKSYARQIMQRLRPDTDIVFSPGSIPLSYLDVKQPTVFYTDATFAAIKDYYHYYSGLSRQYIKEGMEAEFLALKKCSLAIYASDWAAESAIRNYNIDSRKVKVVPFGANIEKRPSPDDVKMYLKERDKNKCHILFIGVEWERKGADIVIDTVRMLNEMGLNTEVHLVGIPTLPLDEIPPYIINHGFISKDTAEGREKIEELISQSHFLFVPSRAEAFGVVFCEAMSFGVPCVSAATGGIPTIINNTNGIILSLSATAKDYAEQIYKTFNNNTLYNELALSAFNDYKTRLNWDVAMGKVVKYMEEL